MQDLKFNRVLILIGCLTILFGCKQKNETLFKLLPPDRTGIEFANSIEETADFNIVIEGHTDDVPLAGGGTIKNNWELSSIRACRVLEYFLGQGFKKEKMTAIGYGDARPLVPNRDANGVAIPINQSQNRRVVMKLLKGKAKTL